MSTWSPEQIGAVTTALGAAAATTITILRWVFSAKAQRAASRRADLLDMLERQTDEIAGLRTALEEAEQERYRAERERAIAEGVLFRLGLRRENGGEWLLGNTAPAREKRPD